MSDKCEWDSSKHPNQPNCPTHSNSDKILKRIEESEIKQEYIDYLKKKRMEAKVYLNQMIMYRDRGNYPELNKPENMKKYEKADKDYKELTKKIKYFEESLKTHDIIKVPSQAEDWEEEYDLWKELK